MKSDRPADPKKESSVLQELSRDPSPVSELPELSRDPPPIPDLPEDASVIQLARGYASTAAFILHQWPSLIRRFQDLEKKLDGVIAIQRAPTRFWMGATAFLAILVTILAVAILRR